MFDCSSKVFVNIRMFGLFFGVAENMAKAFLFLYFYMLPVWVINIFIFISAYSMF